jgi:WD40-like Beta Propeller Repeat
MRRGGTVLVVVAVSAIALAAGWDALRGGDDPGAQPEEQATGSTGEDDGFTNHVPQFQEADPNALGGVLYYTDEACQLRAAELPDIRPADAPNWDECRFTLSPDATRVGDETTGWDPHSDPRRGRLYRVDGATIQVATNDGPEGGPIRGTAPAWRPDGTLTYFTAGAIRDWPEGRTVVPANRLRMVVTEHPNAPGVELLRNLRVVEHYWLDQDRLVAQIKADVRGGRPSLDLVAVFDDGLPFASTDFLGEVRNLWSSPFGTYYAVLTDTLGLYDFNGNSLPLPELEGSRAVAWSPDEDWMAVATDASVYVLTPGQADEVERFALVANDLDWRGPESPDGLTGAEDARGWLGPTGASGRLVVSLPEEDGCSLHALQIPELTWADEPAGVPSPCRFSLGPDDELYAESAVPRPQGRLFAQCDDAGVTVFDTRGIARNTFNLACAPTWTPDGRLTFIRDGQLVLFETPAQGEQRLMTRAQLGELLGRPSALEEIAWVRDDQFWAAVRSGETATLALLTTGQLAMSPSFTTRMIERLRVSFTGIVAAETDRGVVFFDNGGRRALTFPNGRAVTWAPDQVIAAIATPQSILLVAPISGEVVSLPLAVRDLEWVVP